MLSESTQELLTAFVDGALTRRERKAVLRLLNRSSEARKFLQELHENAHRVRKLPKKALPADFSKLVVKAIQDRGLEPATTQPKRPASTRSRTPRWVGGLIAASVLVAVGLSIAFMGPNVPDPKEEGPSNASVAKLDAPKESPPVVAKVETTSKKPEIKPILDSGNPIALKDLAKKTPQLARELKDQEGIHLNLVARNDGKTFDRLQEAFQNSGIQLVLDPDAQVRMNQGKPYLVYVENVQPQELQNILKQLGKDDAKAAFRSVEVGKFSSKDQEQLVFALGISKKDFETPPELFRQTMIQAPAAAETKNKLASEGKPAKEIQPERLAVALSEGASTSTIVNRFVSNRQKQQKGSMRILLVVKPE